MTGDLPARRHVYPHGVVDLGVAHGLAGAIGFLARAYRRGRRDAGELLEGAVSKLLASQVVSAQGRTMPSFAAPGAVPEAARSAWCYGDPGVASVLVMAAQVVGRHDWEQEGVRLACLAAERPVPLTGVTDTTFCHGSAGLAHVFNRLYQATGNPCLGDAARAWLDRTLDTVEGAVPLGLESASQDKTPWNGTGVLEGAAGVALVLLAATGDIEPAWDRMFLLSGSERP